MTALLEMNQAHVSEDDLERYHLGLITDKTEQAELEKHLLSCPACMERSK